MPSAEIEITETLVRLLLDRQFPALTQPLRRMANGWDNVIFRLGEDLAVRMPRRALAAELIGHEQRWLPVIAPTLPLAVPVPLRSGRPDAGYPWPWSITPWFDGHSLAESSAADRRPHATALGHFYAALHVPAEREAPANAYRGIPLPGRSELLERHLSAAGLDEESRIRDQWAELSTVPGWSDAPVWLHGDPHPGNVVISEGKIAAVIDFGDLTAGDPATDLALGWLAFDRTGREDFAAAYSAERTLTASTWDRARCWALCLAVALIANSDDEPVLAGVARFALQQVLAER
ncbi:MAG TPA: aminoglycoside phosphotransferase family protein [Microlunatus sp.]|nr:aminoglycoside phosphotransferase family protein [Microlunatus sp.]